MCNKSEEQTIIITYKDDNVGYTVKCDIDLIGLGTQKIISAIVSLSSYLTSKDNISFNDVLVLVLQQRLRQTLSPKLLDMNEGDFEKLVDRILNEEV